MKTSTSSAPVVAATNEKQDYSMYAGRRRVPRRPLHCRIGILVGGQYVLAHAHEIGEGGMMIDSPIPLSKGERLVISFRVPQTMQGVMLSHVVYVLKPKTAKDSVRYGIQFDQVGFDTKRMIRNFVASSRNDNLAEDHESTADHEEE